MQARPRAITDVTAQLLALGGALCAAELRIALLARCRPSGMAALRAELNAALARGELRNPTWAFDGSQNLADLRKGLERLRGHLESLSIVWSELLIARLRELELEADLVEARGTGRFAQLAAERFRGPSAGESHDVELWLGSAMAGAGTRDWFETETALERIRSDDERDPRSLVSQLRCLLGSRQLPIRVEFDASQSAVAAVGEGVVCLRPNALLTEREALRIVVHEVEGHILPRLCCGPFRWLRAGGPQSVEDEEGRALLLERNCGLMDPRRAFELATRHRMAVAQRAGADFVETVRLALSAGAEGAASLDWGLRIFRGGGLARELVYLPAMVRVQAALATAPELEGLLAQSRAGLALARLWLEQL